MIGAISRCAVTGGVFSALEHVPGLAASALDWRDLLGASARMVEQFLQPAGRVAESCRCALGCGCSHQVVPLGGDRFAGVCVCSDAGGCGDLELKKADLEVLELNVPRLGREIARALECRPVFSKLPVRHTWQIGAWADVVPVLLTIQPGAAALHTALLGISSRIRARFLLLVPTSNVLDVAVLELAASVQASIFGLNTLIKFSENGRMEPIQLPGVAFRSLTPEPVEVDEDAARSAFVLIEQLDKRGPRSAPSVLTVFRLYCLEALSAAEIARKCRCSKTTVIERLKGIRQATGSDPLRFRRLSDQFHRLDAEAAGGRARRIHGPALLE